VFRLDSASTAFVGRWLCRDRPIDRVPQCYRRNDAPRLLTLGHMRCADGEQKARTSSDLVRGLFLNGNWLCKTGRCVCPHCLRNRGNGRVRERRGRRGMGNGSEGKIREREGKMGGKEKG